jgi:2-haloacid dehalogenase
MPAAARDPSPSDAPAPTTVVFDLGGVLIDWNPRHLYRKLFDDEEAMESFLAEVVTPDWNSQQDAGRPWADALEVLTAQHPEHRDLIAAYWHRWPETLGDAIEPTVAVLGELRDAGVRLFALSNWSAETFPIARPRYPFLEWFDGIVISGELKVTKPDPRIFRHLLERYGLDPAATVFIDDSIANVRAAEALGIVGLRFEDAASLRRELAALGVLGVVEGAS